MAGKIVTGFPSDVFDLIDCEAQVFELQKSAVVVFGEQPPIADGLSVRESSEPASVISRRSQSLSTRRVEQLQGCFAHAGLDRARDHGREEGVHRSRDAFGRVDPQTVRADEALPEVDEVGGDRAAALR